MSNLAIEAAVTGPRRSRLHAFKRVLRRVENRVGEDPNAQRLSLSSAGYLYKREGKSDRQQASTATEERSLRVGKGHLVVNPMWLTGGSIAVSDTEGAVSPDYRVFEPDKTRLDPRFLHHLLRSQPYRDQYDLFVRANTTFDRRIQQEDLDQLPLLLPEVVEQRRIADFLDDRVTRIDQIVKARHQQIDLAAIEFRSALESEIWRDHDRMPLKHLLDGVTSGPRGWGDLVRDKGTPFVRIGNLRPLGIELLAENLARVDMPSDAEAHRARLTDGDVLLSITATFGEVAVWRRGDGTFSQHVARLRPLDPDDADWIAWVLQTVSAHDQYKLSAYGGTKIGMGLDQVRNLEVPRTDPDTRVRVAAAVNREWATFAARQWALARSTELMLEYKQSLIAAAVTGELDVRTTGSGVPG